MPKVSLILALRPVGRRLATSSAYWIWLARLGCLALGVAVSATAQTLQINLNLSSNLKRQSVNAAESSPADVPSLATPLRPTQLLPMFAAPTPALKISQDLVLTARLAVNGKASATGSVSNSASAPPPSASAPASSPGALPELVRLAIRTNPLVKSKLAELLSADASVQGAKWQFYPAPFSRGERFEGSTLAVVGLRQPLWTGGRLTADLVAAEAGRGVSSWEVAVSRHDIALRVASAWLEAVSAKGQLDAAQSGLVELQALEAMMQRRVATGYSASVDANLVQARLMQTRTEIDRAQSDTTIALNALDQLTGQSWSIGQLGMPTGAELHFPSSGAWVDAAVDSHPANRRALARQELAKAQVQQARKQVMPTLSARAEYQKGQYIGSNPQGSRFFIGFEQSFGSGLSSVASVDAALAMLTAAQEQSEAQRRDLLSQIKADLASLESARKRVVSLQSNVGDMQTVSDSYRRAFDAGRRSWLELLNVVRERTEVAQQVARARAEVDYYTYRLRVHQGTEGILE